MAPPLKYKIHPAIGIARLGDSPDFFVGPEIPGAANASDIGSAAPPYKSGDQIKPQAARFRVFEYADNGKGYEVKREVNLSEADIDSLVWEVHVANRKASFFAFNGLAGFDRAAEPRRNGATNESKRKKLEIDPGPRTIFGKSKPPEDISKKNPKKESWPDPAPVPAITKLGRLATDKNGNLLVIGAEGLAVSRPGAAAINDYANNDGWFDDVFDGSVKAFLKFKGGKSIEAEPAWVICGPPDFAPALFNVVTLYDVLYDLAARELKLPGNEILFTTGELANLSKINSEFRKAGKAELSAYKPDFATEIFPILARADMMRFVFGPAASAHVLMAGQWNDLASNSSATAWRRQTVFNSLRPPDAKATDTKPDMPKLLGDEPEALSAGIYHQRVRATLTHTQYALMKQWAKGDFIPAAGKPAPKFGPHPITPHGLDRAALEACVGAAMYPGIEVSWQIRFPKIYSEPFRIDQKAKSPYPGDKPGSIRAGHFSRQMALPWQADFLLCRTEKVSAGKPFEGTWAWWPAQRPDNIFESVAEFLKTPPNHVLWNRATKSGVKGNWPSGGDQPNWVEMIDNWRKFGFIVEDTANNDHYIEKERKKDVP